jgi:hypothetical protein
MSNERVPTDVAKQSLANHQKEPRLPEFGECVCGQCMAMRDLLDSRARVKELARDLLMPTGEGDGNE